MVCPHRSLLLCGHVAALCIKWGHSVPTPLSIRDDVYSTVSMKRSNRSTEGSFYYRGLKEDYSRGLKEDYSRELKALHERGVWVKCPTGDLKRTTPGDLKRPIAPRQASTRPLRILRTHEDHNEIHTNPHETHMKYNCPHEDRCVPVESVKRVSSPIAPELSHVIVLL